jgi:hypothetical protein
MPTAAITSFTRKRPAVSCRDSSSRARSNLSRAKYERGGTPVLRLNNERRPDDDSLTWRRSARQFTGELKSRSMIMITVRTRGSIRASGDCLSVARNYPVAADRGSKTACLLCATETAGLTL